MKTKGNEGFSLIEILVAIVLLGAMVVPTCTALVMCIKINQKTDDMLQAQLAVSSAVEILMAEGASLKKVGEEYACTNESLENVSVTVIGVETINEKVITCDISVSEKFEDAEQDDNSDLVSIDTTVRVTKVEVVNE